MASDPRANAYAAGRRDAWLRVLDEAIRRLANIENPDEVSGRYGRIVLEAEETRSALHAELVALGDEMPEGTHMADMVRRLAKWAHG